MTQDGTVVNAVYGFAVILEKLLEQHKPAYMAVAWDLPGSTFRHEANIEYKAQREEKEPELYAQIPIIQEMLAAYGVSCLSEPGFEADDILGTVAEKFGSEDVHVLIVTGDHDTMQLVNDNVSVLTFVKGVSQTKTYTAAEVKERFGVTPEQIVDYKSLVGDTSDNIKGFAGIGPKTAADILNTYSSLDGVMEAATNEGLPSKWQKHFDGAEKKIEDLRYLVTIRRDVAIPSKLDSYKSILNPKALHQAFARLEFKALAQKYAHLMTEEAVEEKTTLTKVESIEKLKVENNTYYLLLEANGFVLSDGLRLAPATKAEVKKLIGTKIILVTHDGKGILHVIKPKAIKAIFFDAILGAYLVDSNTRDYSLEALAEQFLARAVRSDSASSRIEGLGALYTYFKERIEKDGLARVNTLEQETLPVLYCMEELGVTVDLEALKDLSKFAEQEIAKLEKEIHRLAGREFNIQSPSQLAVVLFEDLKLPTKGIKKTKSGYSTRATELEKLWDTHSIVERISEYREIAKLKSTYIDTLPSYVDQEARIHTTYNQTGTVTGRLSSTDPNLQNIPIRTELGNMVRAAFVAQEGYKLVSIDYSQIELRLVADMSGDEEFIGAFKAGEDIHTFTAARVFGKSPTEVTGEERRRAKAINFGILYGMGARSLAKATNVSQAEAAAFIQKYLEIHKGIDAYIEDTKALVHKQEYVTTVWGRRRYLPEVNSGIHMLVASAERMAINAPIQGTKADVVKQAMIDVQNWINTEAHDVRMLLQVHDELVFEIKEEQIEKTIPHIVKLMENVWQGRVSLAVNCKVGVNWGKMETI